MLTAGGLIARRSPPLAIDRTEGTMHEHGVTERILQVVLQHATEADARRVTDVYLVVGELSDVSPESVTFYWDEVSRGSVAEGARLHFERAPTEIRCWACGLNYTPTEAAAYCPSCLSGVDRKALEHDIRMTAIDVEGPGDVKGAIDVEGGIDVEGAGDVEGAVGASPGS